MKNASIAGKEIIKVFSSVDPHTYWTLVVDVSTTTKNVKSMVVDKLGEQQVSRGALTITIEIIDNTNTTTDSIKLSEDDNILAVSSKLKKKYKKNAKLKFVLHGLDKIERVAEDGKSPALSRINSGDGEAGEIGAGRESAANRAHTNGGERKSKSKEAKIAVVSNNTKTKKHLTLIHVFYNNHIYWTLAIDPTCIVGDVCKILEENLRNRNVNFKHFLLLLKEMEDESQTSVDSTSNDTGDPKAQPATNDINPNSAPQMFKGLSPNLAITRLEDDVLVIDILKNWGKSTKWKFFVKEDAVDRKPAGRNDTTRDSSAAASVGNTPEDLLKVKSHNAPILICASEKNSDDITSTTATSMISDEQRKNPINIWIPEVEIKISKKISSGAFAKVFHGIYKGNGRYVAVKVLKGSLSEEVIANFKHEFTILSQVKSPYLVTFYGAYIQKKLTMVMEYCPRGTLYDVLKNPDENISWERVLVFFTQTVKGIQALHNCTPPILHRDLKSLNLLVDDDWVVKVADFGLSRFNTVSNHSSLGRASRKICGTMAYCAPEVYTGERFTVKSDIYSLGIILWELVTRCACKTYKAPYSEYTFISFDFQIIIQTSQHGLRPTIPQGCPPSLQALIQACWQAQPQLRPTCDEILSQIDLLSKELGNSSVSVT